ncbi:helix-turn-helix domain-containing protein [bacterium]|nr:helix-turn-helix domain-containing protein [bacterium]
MTGNHLRAARALIGMEQIDLAEKSGVSVNTIRNMEAFGSAAMRVRLDTIEKVRAALEAAGVVFLPENGNGPGVALRKP